MLSEALPTNFKNIKYRKVNLVPSNSTEKRPPA